MNPGTTNRFRAAAVFAALLLSTPGFAQEILEGRGTGQKKLYKADLEKAWRAMPRAVVQSGATVKESDKGKCAVVGETGVSAFSWGERIAVFCEKKSDTEIEIEVVSKRAFALNLAASDSTSRIFTLLDSELGP
jgi:hypothetical protein